MAHHRLATQVRCGFGGIQNGKPDAVRIWLLGGFEVSVGSRTVGENEWRLRKARSLIKLLALAREHRLHRERILDTLWPEMDMKRAANNLHHALHFARRALEGTPANTDTFRYLTLRDGLLTLCPDGPLWVDIEAFESAVATAQRSREPAAYRAAVALYAGDLLPEDLYEPWMEEKREELRHSYHTLLIELAGLHEERGEHGLAIEALRRAVAEEPASEEARVNLMRLYALSGQHRRALLQYERLREALREELDTEPGAASRRLYEEIRAGNFPAAPSVTTRLSSKKPADCSRHNLPASLTSFVGRENALLEVKGLLSMTRLLTLSGAGGAGKTRLALEVARDLVGAYPEGVWMTELAPISEEALLPQAVAQALGVREQAGRPLTQTLSDHLASGQTLLVLDNCEHLLNGAAHLAEALLSACPKLRILATSREPLGVPGEAVRQVPPLSLPGRDGESNIEGLMRCEAVRLFVDRARSRMSGFELTRENAGAVARVCLKLDGMPLAIELATARMGALAIGQIAQRLDDSLDLLAGGSRTAEPRHKTLRATLDWSHELLPEAERALFRRLSVFAGGWTLEAAEAVGTGDGIEQDNVLDLLSRLVDKSLVVAEASPGANGEMRYRTLEPVRQYGWERLEESGETERVRHRHATYYLALGEAAEPELMGSRPVACLERLETERGNLRAALFWALDADEEEPAERAEIGLRLTAALGRFWDAQGPGEGRRWLEKGLAKSDASPASVRAKALNEAGFIAVYEGDQAAMALLEEALALYKELGDRSGVAFSMSNLGHAVVHLGHRERMVTLREDVLALLSEPLDKRASAHLLLFLGFAAASEMDFEQMEARLEEALALFRELEDIRGLAMCLPSLGMVALSRRDCERAAALFEEGLLFQRELKHKTAIFFGLVGMAGVAALRGQPVRAAKLFGASEALREVTGLSPASLASARYDYEGYLATTRAGLGEAAFDVTFSKGRNMSPERAIEYALSTEDPPLRPALKPRTARARSTDPLTRREREVATLIARGLTNRRIAQELHLSEHTVITHVRRIRKKLGVRSRTQIATWIMRQQHQ